MLKAGRFKSFAFSIQPFAFDRALVPQQLQGGFRKPVFVGASPTRGSKSSDEWRVASDGEIGGAGTPSPVTRHPSLFQDCGVTSSISPCEGDGPGANPGFLTKKGKRATSAQGDWPIRKRICSKSNPSPGTMISSPVFGSELFVAHDFCLTKRAKRQR
jgi:hypothetical protein